MTHAPAAVATPGRPISLAALTALELPPPDLVSTAADAGYSHVGLRLIPATPTEVRHPMIGDTPLVRETRARLDATGIRVLDIEILRLTPQTRVADDCLAAIDTGASLGATFALVAGNDPDEARLADRFAELCDLAARYRIRPHLEFMAWTDAKDLVQAARIVERAGRANGGILIDAFHFSRSRCRIADIAGVPAARFGYLQLNDVPAAIPATNDGIVAEARAERRFPGDGDLDLAALIGALPPGIPLSLEVPTVELAKTVPALERARRAIAGARRVLARVGQTVPRDVMHETR
ncbi:MAG TPA: TIM barrel protein [Casimicrobiaceae bacterium]|nr:TIM barrel protein [Casimicrobiaceae bacterium]